MVPFYKAVAAISSIATLAAVVSFLPVAESSPYTISDDRVRNLDITPVLGRGYSIMTDSYHSTCLMVDETTTPSYNFEYEFYEFTTQQEKQKSMNGKLKYSFGYWGVKAELNRAYSSTSKSTYQSHMIVGVMRIERFYSSVREEVSPLSDDAKTLLNNQDYVGFFKACGPNYVRGIRRAQEITAIFKFHSSSTETARSYAAGLQGTGFGQTDRSFASKSTFSEVNSSLKIKIYGFGLGLNEEGSDTLIATSLEEFNNVMKFAFKSFTQSKNSYHIGMVYGIEVVPWVDNSAFQVATKLLEDDILVPVPRSMIPTATKNTDNEHVCKNELYQVDRNKFCCDVLQLYDTDTGKYKDLDDESLSSDFICRPLRSLDKAVVKENMAGNGEFVARLDATMRYKLVQLGTMEKCLTAVNSIPDKYNNYILLPQATVEYDEAIDLSVSLLHLKLALDPLNDYGLIKQMAKELDEFIDMYYSPCLAALFGMNIDVTPNTEARFFMAYPWHTHEECMHLSCLAPNMRWDRENGGCVPSVIVGPDSEDYGGTATNCAQDVNSESTDCKYDESDLDQNLKKIKKCWEDSAMISFTVDYYMNHFCMPQVTSDEVATSVTRADACDGDESATPNTSATSAPVARRRLSEESNLEEKINNVKNLKKVFDN